MKRFEKLTELGLNALNSVKEIGSDVINNIDTEKILEIGKSTAKKAQQVGSDIIERTQPTLIAKRAVNAAKLNIKSDDTYDNGAALTPPMGWSSWNAFRTHIDENKIYETAKAMEISGLKDAGYQYVNLDDCWQAPQRDENGLLQGDKNAFPSGIPNLVKKINELGLKVGIYSSNGTLTCEDMPSSLGCEMRDAKTFASWGIEYFKYDFCHNIAIPSTAPLIEYIRIENENGFALTKDAESATLYGEASIKTDDKAEGRNYISGLCSNAGKAVFAFNIPESGTYKVTLGIRKKLNIDKHITLLTSEGKEYCENIPASSSFTPHTQHSLKAEFKEGENFLTLYNPIGSRLDSTFTQYKNMGKALKKAAEEVALENGTEIKPIVYSICEWGTNLPWLWGKSAGNLWRTTPDIDAKWASIVSIYEINVNLYKYSKIGAWNDPDMLEVGNGNLTFDENVAHFTLWAFMNAPLILGNDVRKFIKEDGTADLDNPILKILTNKDVIAVNQDKLGIGCRRIKTNLMCDTLVKPLENGEFAVCFFNKGSENKIFELDLNEVCKKDFINIESDGKYDVFDLWTKDRFDVEDELFKYVPAHGVKAFRIKATKA